ncbi:MAG: 4-(cytidine 5'-diphospho)-2-C-methyl-D-erythritol kinase, partial [Gaiellaceae bacterium]
MRRAPAPAKINLALVVGPPRGDGKHEVVTVLQRVDLGDRVAIALAPRLEVNGFPGDTLVRDALAALATAARVEPGWRATIAKRIPVAAGLGGGSSDAATALRLANETLPAPFARADLAALAATLGADVPFFLAEGPQLGRGDGSELEPLELPQDYWIVLALPHGAAKESTANVYRRFDERGGAQGWEERREALDRALAGVQRPR